MPVPSPHVISSMRPHFLPNKRLLFRLIHAPACLRRQLVQTLSWSPMPAAAICQSCLDSRVWHQQFDCSPILDTNTLSRSFSVLQLSGIWPENDMSVTQATNRLIFNIFGSNKVKQGLPPPDTNRIPTRWHKRQSTQPAPLQFILTSS